MMIPLILLNGLQTAPERTTGSLPVVNLQPQRSKASSRTRWDTVFQYKTAAIRGGYRYGFGEDGAVGNGFGNRVRSGRRTGCIRRKMCTVYHFDEYIVQPSAYSAREPPDIQLFLPEYGQSDMGIKIIGTVRESRYPEIGRDIQRLNSLSRISSTMRCMSMRP
jgi:hypothetical protein